MTRQQLTFLASGLAVGIVTTIAGRIWPGFLAFGVGVLFFLAVLISIRITGSQLYLDSGLWRMMAAICISVGGYLLAVFTFLTVGGYWADWLRINLSTEKRFGIDLWIGLFAGVLVASVCIEFLVYVLTSKWSNHFLFRLAAAGIAIVLVTFTIDRIVQSYWTFYGVLLPLSEGLFCLIIGSQIGKTRVQGVGPPFRL